MRFVGYGFYLPRNVGSGQCCACCPVFLIILEINKMMEPNPAPYPDTKSSFLNGIHARQYGFKPNVDVFNRERRKGLRMDLGGEGGIEKKCLRGF